MRLDTYVADLVVLDEIEDVLQSGQDAVASLNQQQMLSCSAELSLAADNLFIFFFSNFIRSK